MSDDRKVITFGEAVAANPELAQTHREPEPVRRCGSTLGPGGPRCPLPVGHGAETLTPAGAPGPGQPWIPPEGNRVWTSPAPAPRPPRDPVRWVFLAATVLLIGGMTIYGLESPGWRWTAIGMSVVAAVLVVFADRRP